MMPNFAHVLPTDRELRQSIWCLPEGMVIWQGLLHRGLTVQVVPGQCLYHAGPVSYHGHHLFLRYGKVQILPLHREHTPWLVPERCGGILGVEGTKGGISLIGEGCGAQCSKVKDHVVKDKLHLDPGVLECARESRRAAHEEVGGVHKTWLLKFLRDHVVLLSKPLAMLKHS